MPFLRRALLLLLLPACGRVGYGRIDGLAGDGTVLDASDAASDAFLDADVEAGTDAGMDASVPTNPTFAELCLFPKVTTILDGILPDDDAGTDLAQALSATCASGQTARAVSESTQGVLDPTTKRPLLGPDDLGTLGGDDFYQDVMSYLMPSHTPITTQWVGNKYEIRVRATNQLLASIPVNQFSGMHDIAVLEIVRDPASGTVLLVTYGYLSDGTRAGAYYFRSFVAPNLASDTKRWYVIEWTNGDANAAPSAGDTFTVLASGS